MTRDQRISSLRSVHCALLDVANHLQALSGDPECPPAVVGWIGPIDIAAESIRHHLRTEEEKNHGTDVHPDRR